ncbi:MAG: cytosine permease, partial [Granulosicoccus sp.]
MNRPISADPIRRHYNQWVSNEMLEDCALRFTALKRRRWSCMQVANTALGSISFLALEAIGAAITLQYGWINAVSAIVVVSVVIFLLGIPIAIHAAKAGVDIDLLTRGAGFGYLGSTITSLIYAGFTFIYFALEAAIMATALEVCFGIPLSVGYLLSSVVIIPVVVYGITMISHLQRVTQYVWLLMQIAPFLFLAWQSVNPMEGWNGLGLPARADSLAFDWLMFGAASAVVFSLVVQIGEQVDYLRFLPVKTHANRHQWRIALFAAGPGWIIIGAVKMLAGGYLCLLAVKQGLSLTHATDPVHLYINAWANWLSPELALAITGLLGIICQFKIN